MYPELILAGNSGSWRCCARVPSSLDGTCRSEPRHAQPQHDRPIRYRPTRSCTRLICRLLAAAESWRQLLLDTGSCLGSACEVLHSAGTNTTAMLLVLLCYGSGSRDWPCARTSAQRDLDGCCHVAQAASTTSPASRVLCLRQFGRGHFNTLARIAVSERADNAVFLLPVALSGCGLSKRWAHAEAYIAR